MTLHLGIVCEAKADFETAAALADRVLVENVDWIERDNLSDFRSWCGYEPTRPFLSWQEVKEIAKQLNIRVHGKFAGEPGAPDAAMARKAILIIHHAKEAVAALFLIRDDDRQTERREGLNQARKYARQKLQKFGPIIIGLAHTKRESWVLSGFIPGNDNEKNRLKILMEELHFDPCKKPELLTDKNDWGPKSAKRVLGVLTKGNWERECACWEETDWTLLRENGKETGLVEYLQEIDHFLLPLFDPTHPTKAPTDSVKGEKFFTS